VVYYLSKTPKTENTPVITFPPPLKELSQQQLLTLVGEGFTMNYPTSWSLKTGENAQVLEYAVKPKNLGPSDSVPSITIYIFKNADKNYTDSRMEKLRANGYSQESVSLGNLSGTKFTGEVGYYTVGTNIINEKVQDTQYFLNRGTDVFEISYKYAGDKNNKQEEFFNSYISTFTAR
jgi:hypothetical protein